MTDPDALRKIGAIVVVVLILAGLLSLIFKEAKELGELILEDRGNAAWHYVVGCGAMLLMLVFLALFLKFGCWRGGGRYSGDMYGAYHMSRTEEP